MSITEALLTTNNFNRPKVLKGNDALSIIITRLIMLDPGRIIGMPIEAGVGLVTKYRYIGEDDLQTLKLDIEHQISTYIPDVQSAEITCELRDPSQCNDVRDSKVLIIGIKTDSYIYAVGTDGQKVYQAVEEENGKTTLSSLLGY